MILKVSIVAVLLSAAYVGSVLRSDRAGATPARRALFVLLGCMSFAMAANEPAFADHVNRAAGTPVARLLHLSLLLAATGAIQTMLVHWSSRPRRAAAKARWRQVIVGAATLIMAGMFLYIEQPGQFGYAPQANPGSDYELVAHLVVAWALIDLGRMAYRFAPQLAHRPFSQLGLQLFLAGALFGLLYALLHVAQFLIVHLGGQWPDQITAVRTFSGRGCAVLIAAGAVTPSLGPAVLRLYRRVTDAYRCTQLHPLWRTMADGFPEINLEATPPRALIADWWACLRSRNGWMLHRRIMEIRDGYLAVRPWLDHTVSELADFTARYAALEGDEQRATVEAATIVAALRARARGEEPTGTGELEGGAPDLAGEIEWLTQVSRRLHSPLVAEVLSRHDSRNGRGKSWVDDTLANLGLPVRR